MGYAGQNPLRFVDWNGLEQVSVTNITKSVLTGVKDGFVNMVKETSNSIRHPVKTFKQNIEKTKQAVLHPVETAKKNLNDLKNIATQDPYVSAYVAGQLAIKASIGTSVSNAAKPCIEGALQNIQLPGNGVGTLALPAPTESNPWMEGTMITSMLAPKDFVINMAMAPGQPGPGSWGTLETITSVDFVRNNLAVTPEFKKAIDSVQQYVVPEGTRIQTGIAGPQEYEGVLYPGGATQVQVFDKSKLISVGNAAKIE